MRILGLDVGEKRIGVAKADSGTRIAVPVGYVTVDGSEWEKLAYLANLHNTEFFVVGLPRSNEGNETQQTLFVRNFTKTLVEKIPSAKVRFQDESLTSVEAEERLKSRKKKYEKGEIDAEAATIILQDFLESFTVGAAQREVAPEVEVPKEAPTGVVAGIKSAAVDAKDTAAGLAKKEAGKAKLNAKKVTNKMKTVTKWVSGIGILAVIGLIVAGGIMLALREQQKQEYAAWVAEQEAKQAETFDFTILPGETIYTIQQKLAALGYTTGEIDEAFNSNYDFAFLQGRPEGATLEGYLYGETYQFYEGTPVKEILRKYLEGMDAVIKENNLEAGYAARGLSLFEGITLASIVQKEANASDMPTVAQVFLTRLEYNMSLGSDVTVSYALDTIDPYRQTYGDNAAALVEDSCYNTRQNRGLPCGPISNPGLSALLAVAQPTDTSYLYFLTGDDGLMYYSYTEDEHLLNAAVHCSELCSVSL